MINSSPNNSASLLTPSHRPRCLFLSTQEWLVMLLADISLRQHSVLYICRNRFLPQHSCFFHHRPEWRRESWHVCLYFLLYHEQEMRGTLISPMSSSSRVPDEVELILSLNVLSLYNMSGAVDMVVKKIHMTCFPYSFKVVKEMYYTSKKHYNRKKLGCSRSWCQGVKP